MQGLLDQQILEHHRFSDEFSLNFKCSQLQLTRRGVNVPLAEPQNSCEVYVMNLPRDVLMRELHAFMATCGMVYEIRLLTKFSGFCKGKCFVRYQLFEHPVYELNINTQTIIKGIVASYRLEKQY